MKPKISASILNADFSFLGNQIAEAVKAGIDWVHLDIMDGHFVPNISFGPFIVETCRKLTTLPLDIHLMIDNPDKYLSIFAKAGSTYISVHIENNPNIHRTLQTIRELRCKPGIAINPGTPASAINSVLNLVDLILVMTVNPGFGSQVFLEDQIEKITQISKMISSSNNKPILEVDGGLSSKTIPIAQRAGAEMFVIGSSIFSDKDGIQKAIEEIHNCLN